MSEFNEPKSLEEVPEVPETLEAPKKATRKPRASKLAPLDTTFEKESLEECTPVKKCKGRPKKVVEPVAEDQEDASPPKPKRVQTEAQRENFKKALAQRQANIALRKAAKELEKQVKEEQQKAKKAEVERKIVKKSICIKKKEILSQAALDEISDDEIPDSVIQKVIKKQRAKKVGQPKPVEPIEPPKSKYNFV